MNLDLSSIYPVIVECCDPLSRSGDIEIGGAWGKPKESFLFIPSSVQEDPEWFVGIAVEGGKRGVNYPSAFKMEFGIGNRVFIDTSHLFLNHVPIFRHHEATQKLDVPIMFQSDPMVRYKVVKISAP